MWRNGRAYDPVPRGPGFETRLGQLVSPLGKEIIRHFSVAQFAVNAHWAEPSLLLAPQSQVEGVSQFPYKLMKTEKKLRESIVAYLL